MSRYCTHCGCALSDTDTRCPCCNTPAANQSDAAENVSKVEYIGSGVNTIPPSQKRFKDTVIGIVAVALVAIIVIWIVCLIFGGGYKKPIDNYFEGLNDADAGQYKKAFYPAYDIDITDEELEFQLVLSSKYFGEDIKIFYDIKDKKELTTGELESYKEDIEYYTEKKIKVSKGYEAEVKITIKGDNTKESSTIYLPVIKINGKWYLADEP